eukprot:1302866-Rhodomonas_salina.2
MVCVSIRCGGIRLRHGYRPKDLDANTELDASRNFPERDHESRPHDSHIRFALKEQEDGQALCCEGSGD